MSIAPSREALEYTRKTQAKIKEKAQSVIKDLQKVASEKLKNSGDLWEAKNNYAKIHNAFDYSLRDILKDCFVADPRGLLSVRNTATNLNGMIILLFTIMIMNYI